MPELDEQLRSYFDAIADEIADETEASRAMSSSDEGDAVLTPTGRGDPRSVLSRNLVLLAAAIALLAGLYLALRSTTGDSAPVFIEQPQVTTVEPSPPTSDIANDGGVSVPSPPTPDTTDPGRASVLELEWVEVALDEATFGDEAELIAVAASDSVVVVGGAVGDDAALWTSTDRTTWTRVAHDEEVFGGPSGAEVSAIAPWRSGFVAVGLIRGGPPTDQDQRPASRRTAAAVWISEDGFHWERVAHDEEVFGAVAEWQESFLIAAHDDRLVIVGVYGQAVWTSNDGQTWSKDPRRIRTFGRDSTVLDVVATEEGFVGVGSAVWVSADGAVWEQVAQADGLVDVEAGPEGFVAISGGGSPSVVWTASELSKWTRAAEFPVPGGPPIVALAAGDEGLVAISGGEPQRAEAGGAQMFVSTDGTTWESADSLGLLSESAFASLNIIREGHAITAFGANFVAVGWQFEGSSMWTTVDPTAPSPAQPVND